MNAFDTLQRIAGLFFSAATLLDLAFTLQAYCCSLMGPVLLKTSNLNEIGRQVTLHVKYYYFVPGVY